MATCRVSMALIDKSKLKLQSRLLMTYVYYRDTFPSLLQSTIPRSLPGLKPAERPAPTPFLDLVGVNPEPRLLRAFSYVLQK